MEMGYVTQVSQPKPKYGLPPTFGQQQEMVVDLTAKVNALNLAASQSAQNNYIVNALRMPTPIPAYQVPNPYANYCQPCGCGCGCGFGI